MPPLADATATPDIIDSPLAVGLREGHTRLEQGLALLCGKEGAPRACRIALLGSLLGAFLFFDDWMRVLWLVGSAGFAFLCVNWRKEWASARRDGLRVAGLHFLMWMTARSLAGYGMIDGESGMLAAGWLLGGVLLVVYVSLIWLAAQNEAALEALGRWVGMAAAVAALVSMILFYLIIPGHVFGERLMNGFVYGGWNAVCTGLTSGFAAVWLVCLRDRESSGPWRWAMDVAIVVLLVAVCFTRSRGALLAILAAYGALTLTRGVRRVLWPWAVMVVVVGLFALSGPLVERVAAWQVQSRLGQSETSFTLQPLTEMVQRGDAGRFDLYQRAFQTFNTTERWIFGIGQWGPEEACCRSLTRLQYHLHSAYLATFVHGGLVGLALFFIVLACGVRRAVSLASRGSDTWLALLVYGCAGLLFDGQTFTSFTSIPQMETLIFTFPLVAASSIWWHQQRARA